MRNSDAAKILLVENEANTCELLKLFLGMRGFEVMMAHTTDEIVAMLAHECFLLCILDPANSEGMDVLQLVRAISPRLPVLVCVSGMQDELLLRQALSGRVEGFIRRTSGLREIEAEVLRITNLEECCCGVGA